MATVDDFPPSDRREVGAAKPSSSSSATPGETRRITVAVSINVDRIVRHIVLGIVLIVAIASGLPGAVIARLLTIRW